jgi:hypothetical protein
MKDDALPGRCTDEVAVPLPKPGELGGCDDGEKAPTIRPTTRRMRMSMP